MKLHVAREPYSNQIQQYQSAKSEEARGRTEAHSGRGFLTNDPSTQYVWNSCLSVANSPKAVKQWLTDFDESGLADEAVAFRCECGIRRSQRSRQCRRCGSTKQPEKR